MKFVVGVVGDVKQIRSDCAALGVGEQPKVSVVIMGVCKAKRHAEAVVTAQIREKVGWQVKPHPLGVKEAETAVAAV